MYNGSGKSFSALAVFSIGADIASKVDYEQLIEEFS